MTLQICDIAPHLEVETTECPVRFYNCIDYRGLRSDQRQRVTQHVIHHPHAARAQASHDLGDVGLRTLQAAAGGGAAIIRTLAKAVLAAAGKWWRAYNIRRAHIAAARELHALDDRTLRDIGVSRSEIEWVVAHGAEIRLGLIGPHSPRFHRASQSRRNHTLSSGDADLARRRVCSPQ